MGEQSDSLFEAVCRGWAADYQRFEGGFWAIAQNAYSYPHPLPYARCYFTVAPDAPPLLLGTVVSPGEEVEASGEEPLRLAAWLEPESADLVRWTALENPHRGGLLQRLPDLGLGDRPRRCWHNHLEGYAAISGGMAVAGITLSGFMVSAPCVSGTCPELDSAQVLGQQSRTLMEDAQDIQDLQDAQTYLDGAVDVLETIPTWSERSPEAAALAETYRQQIVVLDRAIAAAEMATTAEQKAKNPAQVLAHWGTLQLLWQEAVDQMATIPADSPLYPFAQRKIEDYQARMAFARDQRQQEANSQDQLQLAKQEIRLAQLRHAKATSEDEWQMTQTAWMNAIERLRTIDPQTQAGVEAQRLLAAYSDIPEELGDRLSMGILATPAVPPAGNVTASTTHTGERIYQTPINWSDLSQDVPVPVPPPPPTVVQYGEALPN